MKKKQIVEDLKSGKGVLAKHGSWGLYCIKEDGSVGHCYAGRINPKTAELLIKENPAWEAKR